MIFKKELAEEFKILNNHFLRKQQQIQCEMEKNKMQSISWVNVIKVLHIYLEFYFMFTKLMMNLSQKNISILMMF